ncbi:NUCLEAR TRANSCRIPTION FACTOR Y SUBUNIT B-11 [Salix viminalis]|uniref:NUCLEAR TRANSCRIPTION FACTOR Y SUBUNIT B-11 n=1 Tax=Salix viminalis TaxID=40686 RepID=A0A6N2LIM0_SALVM|nr:NUCLEAR TRANSCRIPTION FACTOR Y SUBUNIT B-11 [Salix viminalis]
MTGKRSRVSPVGSPQLCENISESSSKLEQDRFLPIANVSRIMKKSLPANAKISKEAKETVQECVSEFISFITGEASDKCQREKRKTINGDDLLWAMTILGFENYVGPLKVYLNKYRETEGEKNSMARQEDQYLSPTNHGSPAGTLSAEMDLRSYNGAGALCSLGTEVAARSNGENTRFHGYQESNLMVGEFNMNRIRDHGDRNSSTRAMAGQPYHGVSW